AELGRTPPPALPRQKELDEARALAEAMSDEVDVESLLLTDDGLGFRRPGVSLDVLAQLRKGKWAIQDQLDLHGMRRDEAREAVGAFIRNAGQRGLRCLRVVHGKGHGSPGREPVLKSKVHKWLAQRQEVIAFAQATGPQGGAGALIVLLES
ncbi:MAG TPA: Smr/MutS family protein, partial [Burkholderiaceae bacterium]